MNNTDKALAELLGVGTDTIKSLAKLVGDNYEEIYNTIAKEYTYYAVMENLTRFSIVSTIIMFIPTIVSLLCYLDEPEEKKYKDVLRVCCIILAVLIFVLFVASILSPVLSPNIHLIKDLRG